MSDTVMQAAALIVPLIFAIVFHEVAHGLMARSLGDSTAEEQGRLSLNPLRHVDPIGTVLVPGALKLMVNTGYIGRIGAASTLPKIDELPRQIASVKTRDSRRTERLIALTGHAVAGLANFELAAPGGRRLGTRRSGRKRQQGARKYDPLGAIEL